ncbi:hypothetical protein L8R90_18780, partial [Vibrio splendidus]|nr:hypothetical protein [Vibrio splendidus]
LHIGRDKQQDKANQTNGVWVSRYRLLLLEDKSGFPRKAAMNLFCLFIKNEFGAATGLDYQPYLFD